MTNYVRRLPADAELVAEEYLSDRRMQAREMALVSQMLIAVLAEEFGSDDGPIDPESLSLLSARVAFQTIEKGLADLKRRVTILAAGDPEGEEARAILTRS